MSSEQALVLAVDDLSVVIGGKPVLRNISFGINRGEFVGIIGPNGAGKSTLLRSMRGFCPIAGGHVNMFNRPVSGLSDRELARTVAYMQQETEFGLDFSTLAVVAAGRYPYLAWWQNESEEDYRIARKYMAFTGVDSLAEKSVRQVSGGERQRILLAKVLAQETPVIFLDEPTASLDLVYQEEIFRYCQVICRQGKTVLLVAHDIRLAAKFCSRLILLADGGLLADGQPQEVLTADNLAAAYGLNSTVFVNKVTGALDIYTYAASRTAAAARVHIIAGGGSGGTIMRLLHEKAFALSGGVFSQGDTDADVAGAFGVDYVESPPFSPISSKLGQENRRKIACADWAVLSNLCYGEQNIDNLKAAFIASRLVVIEDTPVEERDFTGGRAAALYYDLVKMPQVTVMRSEQFAARVSGGEL